MFSATNIKLRLFADDACLSYQLCDSDYVNAVINMKLRKFDEWLCKNRPYISYSKTKFFLFNRTAKIKGNYLACCHTNIKLKLYYIKILFNYNFGLKIDVL